jgi:hypothetical protein
VGVAVTTPLDVLKLARSRLSSEDKWAWRSYCGSHTTEDGETIPLPGHYGWEAKYPPHRYSLYGAVAYYPPDYDYRKDYGQQHESQTQAYKLLAEEIGLPEDFDPTHEYSRDGNFWNAYSGYEAIVRDFNDDRIREFADILALLDRVIAKAEANVSTA